MPRVSFSPPNPSIITSVFSSSSLLGFAMDLAWIIIRLCFMKIESWEISFVSDEDPKREYFLIYCGSVQSTLPKPWHYEHDRLYLPLISYCNGISKPCPADCVLAEPIVVYSMMIIENSITIRSNHRGLLHVYATHTFLPHTHDSAPVRPTTRLGQMYRW